MVDTGRLHSRRTHSKDTHVVDTVMEPTTMVHKVMNHPFQGETQSHNTFLHISLVLFILYPPISLVKNLNVTLIPRI